MHTHSELLLPAPAELSMEKSQKFKRQTLAPDLPTFLFQKLNLPKIEPSPRSPDVSKPFLP